MRQVHYSKHGPPEVLQAVTDAPKPSRRKGEVLIEVYAAGTNPVDFKIRRGDFRIIPLAKPKVPGGDVAGTVVEAEPGGRFKPGDKVYAFASTIMPNKKEGCYQEFVSLPEAWVAHAPKGISFEQAAGLPLAGLTAWQALDAAALQPGQRVLVHAAAGGVGSIAVQLAKARGLQVVGTASAGNAEYVKGLGADEVIDYNKDRFEEVLVGDRAVDGVIDAIGGDYEPRSIKTLRTPGVLISLLPNPINILKGKLKSGLRLGPRYHAALVSPSAQQLGELAALIEEGRVRPAAVEVLPLEQAARAHELLEEGHVRGKVVLRVKGE